jgi:hypothetical protein
VLARTASVALALLADGVPSSKRPIAAELAERHPKDEVRRTLMRLAVAGRVADAGGKHTLAPQGGSKRAA